MNYLFEPDYLTKKTNTAIETLGKNKPDADFVEFASAIIYDRLKADILRYRVYGAYWWALKGVLARQGYNVGDNTNDDLAAVYSGDNDAQTLVAADMFFLAMSNTKPVDNTNWTLDNRKPDYVLYDPDMEERTSITDSVLAY